MAWSDMKNLINDTLPIRIASNFGFAMSVPTIPRTLLRTVSTLPGPPCAFHTSV